jgi:hypothetical protein
MLLVGSMINAATTVAALLLLGAKAPLWAALAVHFAPLPYNLFLFVSVWRTADRVAASRAGLTRMAALIWLLAATGL